MEEILHQAEQLEKEYDWSSAADSYEKALNLLPGDDFSRKGEMHERLGYAFYRAAFQAESSSDFRERMHQAVKDYGKAKEFYGKIDEQGKAAKTIRCASMISQLGYWLASEAQEKKKSAAECWTLAKDCLKAFEKAGDACEYGRTYNQLSTCIDLGFFFEWDFKAREKMIGEAVDHGERAIKFLSTVGDSVELARAYVKTANYLEVFGYYFVDLSERQKYSQEANDFVRKANELSEEAAMIEVPTVLFGSGPGGCWGDGTDVAMSNFEKALEFGRKTRDKFVIGRALDLLAYHVMWRAATPEDPDERTELIKEALQYTEDARHQYCVINFTSPRGAGFWADAPYASYYLSLGWRETNLAKRRGLLEKALEAAPRALKLAEDSGYAEIRRDAHQIFGNVLAYLAKMAANSEEKQTRLEEALVHMNESERITGQIEPLSCWNIGLMQTMRADAKSDLADLAKDPETRKGMLQEAILDMEASLKLCVKEATQFEKEGSVSAFGIIGIGQYWLGNLSYRLYGLSQNREHLSEAIAALYDAAQSFEKLNLTSRMAECHWRAAQVYDTLGEHFKAAENFDVASNNYRSAGEKIPQLKEFYQDHALYMQAWSEIEKARHHHERQEYGLAEEHFEKAAGLHKSSRHWSYLAPNYFAWAQVEHAEDLSRKEQGEEAKKPFEQAARLFKETKESIQSRFDKIEDADEKQMATNVLKATDTRLAYCKARITVEEAKILDKKGDHYSSSKKYGSAAETFEKIGQTQESEQEKREIKLITTLSRAWQKMTLAEAEASPSLYAEASELFEQARDSSPNEKTKMLVLGHSRFCKALEAGTKFADTRDQALHAAAVQHLASASNYYMKADFQTASEYAKATKLLFDAYAYMDNAEKEKDPDKKAKLYVMIERVLQTSAGSYTRAEHPEKREQVLKLLEKAKEEQELATSMTEALHAPSIVSTTTAFTSPTPTQEEAVGSERFEHADIHATMMIRQKEMKVGENLDLEMELVNAGKGPALLIKVAELIPEGFELTEKPEIYRVEDSYLNMKGKRLDPLKTEDIRITLKPKTQGVFQVKPKILYLDENGKYKSHEPEPVSITVKELGIKGWLKGEK